MQLDHVVVACAANASYAIPLAVMLRSAADHLAADRKLEVWVVDDGLGVAARQRIVESLPSRATVHWLSPDRAHFDGLPLWGRMPINTYDKLTIAECLPAHVGKAIWLDCDTLVLADLAELWDLPMDSAHVLAVTDSLVPTVSSRFGVSGFSDLGLNASSPYFNAGVMVVDAAKWRASKIAAGAVSYLKRFRETVFFWDQEALNAMLAGRWSPLEPRWNWSANLDRLSPNGVAAHDGVNRPSCIVHFSGNLKPWVVREAMESDTAYFRILDETAWHGWRPKRTLSRSLLSWYGSSRLRRAIYPAEQWGMRAIWRVTHGRTVRQ
jgi:lipopolysaccharide biosynthesis glycosyltransferase